MKSESTLLVIPPGFTIKTKHKEISQAFYNTSGEPPWKPDAHLYHSSTDITAHRRGDHLLRDGTSSSSSSHQSKNRELFRIRSFESVSVVTLSSQSLWRQCHAMASFSICHTIFIGFIEPYCSCCFAHAVNSGIVSDLMHICFLINVFSFLIILSAAF